MSLHPKVFFIACALVLCLGGEGIAAKKVVATLRDKAPSTLVKVKVPVRSTASSKEKKKKEGVEEAEAAETPTREAHLP